MTGDVKVGGSSLVALDPEGLPAPRGFSQTIAVGGLVFVSGQLPIDAEGNLVGGDDPVEQARQVFRNLRVALQANRLDLQHIVKFTALVVGKEAYEAFRTVRAELIEPPFPTSTVGCVVDIVIPRAVVEIDVIAADGGSRT
jgi:enamine deaminase RidA (YjgF/YER057c/UK114 family)